MTIRFAAARTGYNAMIAHTFRMGPLFLGANDNGLARTADPVLAEALRHFARHGMRAARVARDNAEGAFAAADTEAYEWWLAICRTLDRRMANAMVARLAKIATTG
ncbi:MAG TPA: hypothetical protein VJM34_01630 [Novosphingobium sp.]|nr:hypothetical protein [Novosphingobium sp.]